MYFLDTLFNDLRTIMTGLVIKYEKKAKENETLESLRASDIYISARNKEDSFHTYQKFDVVAVMNAGIHDPKLAELYANNKHLIPTDKREVIVNEQRKYIISNYTELNNYYRMLIGLPDLEDTVNIIPDESVAIELDIPTGVPLHLLDTEAILRLDKKGTLAELKALYPEKKYLNFLGEQKIDIVRARTSKNFAILDMPSDISESFYDEFNNTYEQCREYFMTVIHIKDFSSRFDLYDSFIALMVMVMTIQRIIVNTFKYGIDRDFYDLGSIQMMFQSYNVPFIEDLPLDYQRMLVRNLNSLLHYKSTDKVLYDICSLLGFERIQIFKYFLMKEHLMDDNDQPIFAYKEVENEDGTVSLVEDPEKMYDLYFQTVELKDRNTALALANTTNRLEYDQVIIEDPFWWSDDKELLDKIYNTEFNYVETKFLNMNIMYKLTEMLFEVIYVFRMLIEKKDQLDLISIELPKLFEKRKIPIFNVVVFLCALISRKNGFIGNIISSPSKTLSVLGFNFKADFQKIKDDIQKNPKLDSKMLTWLLDLNITNPEDINRLFRNVRQLNDFIVERLGDTQDIEEYHAYKKLFNALMITQHTEALFKKKDGTIAETFLEYLKDEDPVLAAFVESAEEGRLTEYIEHILFKVNGLVDELQYLYILNDSNNVLLNAAITLIRFFKSYTTDLASFNILYLMNSRYYNMIKMIHDVESIQKTLGLNDEGINMLYKTNLKYTSKLSYKGKIDLHKKENESMTKQLTYKDKTLKKPVIRDTIRIIREV